MRWKRRRTSLLRSNKATLVHAAEGFADEFVGGVHAGLFGEFVDGFDGFGLFVAEGDEAEDGVGLSFLLWIVSAFGGAGGLPGIDDADFVLELEHDAFGGFAADAFDAGEGFHIAADDGVFEGGDGHAAEDAEGHLGADAGDAVHEEAEEIALVCSDEAKEGVVAIGDVVVGEKLHFFTGMRELVEGGEGDEDEVAHAIDVDGGTVRESFGEAAAKKSDHAGMKAGRCEGASGGLMRTAGIDTCSFL